MSTFLLFTLLWGAPQHGPDFNGDGHGDLAIGVPHEDYQSRFDVGAVNVIYGRGGSTGLDSAGNQILAIAPPFWSGPTAVAGDVFGSALAWGDFNGDGYHDLAVGAPMREVNRVADAGAVLVFRGGPVSLGQAVMVSSASLAFCAPIQAYEHFGLSLAAGDVNRDGRDDLLIGVPHKDASGAVWDTGAVVLVHGKALWGSFGGTGEYWTQANWGEAEEYNDQFGLTIETGHFSGPVGGVLRDDVAIGVPLEDVGAILDAGMICIRNSDGTIQTYWQDAVGIFDECEAGDQFGLVLEAGDYDGGGADDLAVGLPYEDVLTPFNSGVNAGAVQILYSNGLYLNAYGNEIIVEDDLVTNPQDIPQVFGVSEAGDLFGFSLAAGDRTASGVEDLAIGVPLEDDSFGSDVGWVWEVDGGASAIYSDLWNQDRLNYISNEAINPLDRFGYSLTMGWFDQDDRADLVIGSPYDPTPGQLEAGEVTIVGWVHNLDFWHQDSGGPTDPFHPNQPPIKGVAVQYDHFGAVLP